MQPNINGAGDPSPPLSPPSMGAPEPTNSPSSSTSPSLTKSPPLPFISFNINGLNGPSSPFKIRYLINLAATSRCQFILLQETHTLGSSPAAHYLSSRLPHFSWFFANLPSSGWGGVAIGVHCSFISLTCPVYQWSPASASSILVCFVGRQGQIFSIISSYCQSQDSNFINDLVECRS
jgi:exonuclease III